MSELRIIIKPYNENLVIPIEDNFIENVFKLIKKIKTKQKNFIFNIPEIGYCGMILKDDKSKQIYVNNERIIFTNNNITEIIYDPKRKINNLLLKKASSKYSEELNYFFKVLDTSAGKNNLLLKSPIKIATRAKKYL